MYHRTISRLTHRMRIARNLRSHHMPTETKNSRFEAWWHGLLPASFYRYRREPKGSPAISLFLSAGILVFSVATFSYLAVIGSHKTVPESMITVTDISGTDGWTCDMVSITAL